jgi:hypothetical protein
MAVYPAQASGTVDPSRVFQGPATLLNNPDSVFLF